MKITINNEEVLCNKDFTIQEEMLNTSSVILNNVYPKTWEQDKDYVSRFYYPPDYSKCKIFNEIYHPEEKSTASGTNFTLNNVDLDKEYYVEDLKGQTSQNGTPTPTSPVPINTTTGRQDVIVCGKNLVDFNNLVKGQSNVSITWANDVLTVESPSGTYRDARIDITDLIKNNPGKKLRLDYDSIDFSQSNAPTVNMQVTNNGTNSYPTMIAPSGNVSTYTIPSDTSGITQALLRFMSNNSSTSQAGTIVLTKPILHFGDSDTTYEEYKGNTYEINLGKNLFNNDNKNTQTGIVYNNGLTLVKNTDRVARFILPQQLPAGTYTLSCNIVENTLTGLNKFGIAFQNNNNTAMSSNSYLNVNGTTTITATGEFNRMYFFINNDQADTATITIDNVQLEKGSQATSYAEYKTPIELCKIGNYQDKIYKQNGNWYIYKEIGKVVLNGSEDNWALTSDTTNLFLCSSSVINGKYLVQNAYSNYFKNVVNEGITNNFTANNNLQDNEFTFRYGTKDRIYIKSSVANSIANFKTWLSTHNLIVYYVLNTPTNTLIEDEELIDQLNQIEMYTVISEDFYN